MAESFAFNIAEKVLGKLGPLAYQEISMVCGLNGELEELVDTLTTIKAVLLDAEERQANTPGLSIWLGKLKDVCYDADDVVDEFEYEALWWQLVNRGDIKIKVCNFFSCSNPLAFRFKMGHKIKAIREKLDKIAAEKAEFHLAEQFVDSRVVYGEIRMTHSFVQASDVIGRNDDKEKIIKLLMHTSDHENVSVLPIVGIGGLGKTTLAKLVYNDEMVIRHFKLKMWVCVPETFDVKRLTAEIINSATGTNCGNLTMDQMQTRLRDTLRDKLFLLILDDIWNEDRVKWVELKKLLMVGAKGSKIIVTTRSQMVASIMGTVPIHKLQGLSQEVCMSLFVKWAFREGEDIQYSNLVKIGEEIVKKCGGVPLAVRTLGSLLYLKTNERDWQFVRDNEIWRLEQKENDILPALKLSYDAMPSYLKQCFAFCSIFPKDHQFYDFELVQLWIAEGLIQSYGENQELEDIGERYVKELWSRSLFQDVEENDYLLKFEMHDLVHDLALSVAQTECSIINSFHQNISKRVRHVSFCEKYSTWKEIPRFLMEQDNVWSLRTILFPVWRSGPTGQPFVEMCISRFKCLRVLDLSDSRFEVLPSSITDLKHLRYLDLSRNRHIKKLANSICKLLNLQTLRLDGCDGLEGLPRDIGNLINLKHLVLTTRHVFFPEEGIRNLITLRYLQIARCGILESLGEGVQHLSALRTLLIKECDILESLPRSMKNLTALETLAISDCYNLNLMNWEEDIEGLRFSLQTFSIRELPQLVALPQWLQGSARTLQHLCIRCCRNLMTLPEWLQNLTSLQKLEIIDCPLLSALPEGMRLFPALKKLTIKQCPELSRRCRRETHMDWHKIAHVPEITLESEKIKSTDN